MYSAGLRCSEACEFQPPDYQPRSGRPYVRVRRGKGNKERFIPINGNLATLIEDWLEDPARPRFEGAALFPRLIGANVGKPVQPSQVRQLLAGLSKKADVWMRDRDGVRRPVSPHKLRHAYAHRLILNGVTVPEVQKQLGHKSITTTQIYLEVADEISAERIRDALDGRHVDNKTQLDRDQRADLRLAGGVKDGVDGAARAALDAAIREIGLEAALARVTSPKAE